MASPHTQRAILAQLLTRPMSLADLVDATGISLTTLRRAVRQLTQERWIRVVGREEATGGRPASLFGPDDGVHTLVGVHLAHPGMRLIAADLSGNVLERWLPAGVRDLDPDAVHAAVLEFLGRLRRRHPQRRPLGLGVATPGYIDPASGTVLTIGRVPNWNNLPLRDRLREAGGLPVTVGNDMDAMATAEFALHEDAHTHASYAYVGFGEGVKFSMFLQGVPYVGPFGNAGLVDPRLPAGDDGAEAAALLRVRDLLAADRGAAAAVGDAPPADPEAIRARFRDLLARAAADEPEAARLIERMADALGGRIAAFVNLIQPSLLVCGGALAGAPTAVLERIERATRRRLPVLLDNNLIVRPARVVADDAAALGATRVFLRRFTSAAQDHPATGVR